MEGTSEGAPAPESIEVSIFGPGVGECSVLHLGDGKWFVVDSCTDKRGDPIALNYLRKLGVNITEDVTDILVTHWHDDHIAGVAELFEAADSATFHCPSAFDSRNLLQLLSLQRGAKISGSSGCDELANVFEILRERKPKYSRTAKVGPELVKADQVLVRKPPLELHALSPSSTDITNARHDFAELLPQFKSPKRRLLEWYENDASIVLLLVCGERSVLLGADRETTDHQNTGWSVILNSSVRPQVKAGVYKVPHHGSENADREEIWTELLEKDPLSVVAPYRTSGLPRKSDIKRLKSRTTQLYLTAPVEGAEPSHSSTGIDEGMRAVARQRQLLRSGFGQVRVRFDRDDDDDGFNVACFGSAHQI